MIAVDTNILVYSVDANEAAKQAVAVSLLGQLRSQDAVLLWQVACECGAVLTRKQATSQLGVPVPELLRNWLEMFPLVMPSPDVVQLGLTLGNRHQVSYWDALLLAACIDAGVTRLYTEDLQSKPVIEGVEIVSPFVA